MNSEDSKSSKAEFVKSPDQDNDPKNIKRKVSVALQNESRGRFLTRTSLLILLLLPPGFLFGVLFTARGWGGAVVIALEPYYDISRLVAAGGVGTLFLLYLLDFSYWKGIWTSIRTLLVVLSAVVISVGGVLMAREYAALPMLIYLLLVPAYIVLCRKLCWKNDDTYYFLSSLAPALFFMGIMGITAWLVLNVATTPPDVWPGPDNIVKAKYYDKLLCKDSSLICKGKLCPELLANDKRDLKTGECNEFIKQNGCVMTTTPTKNGVYDVNGTQIKLKSWAEVAQYEAKLADFLKKNNITIAPNNSTGVFDPADWPTLRDVDVDCATAAYLLYSGLLVASVILTIFSIVTHFIGRSMKRKSPRRQLRVFGMLGGLSILGMWMATTIAGSTPQISNLVMLFSFVGMTLVAFMVISSMGWGSIKNDLMNSPMIKSIRAAGQSDLLKAMSMFFVIPYFCFLGLSVVNQFFRLYLTPCAKRVGKKERKYCLTSVAHKQLVLIKRWPFTVLFKKVRFTYSLFLFVTWNFECYLDLTNIYFFKLI
jgi:hypothetical protein